MGAIQQVMLAMGPSSFINIGPFKYLLESFEIYTPGLTTTVVSGTTVTDNDFVYYGITTGVIKPYNFGYVYDDFNVYPTGTISTLSSGQFSGNATPYPSFVIASGDML